VSERIDPVYGVRIEPAHPLRRVERHDRDEPRERERDQQQEPPPDEPEDDGLHIDVQA
jgi:hypothetical protein